MNGVEIVASWCTPTILFCVLNLMIGTIFFLKPKKDQGRPSENDDVEPPRYVRVPSLFERVKSINLSRNRSEQPDPDQEIHHYEPEPEPEHEHEPEHHVIRSQSDTAAMTSPATAPAKEKAKARVLKKSASAKVVSENREEEVADAVEEQRRPATVREKPAPFNEDEEVDEKADDFINKFRQQLKLQRLDSIIRYKDMLNRGVGR